MAVTKILKIFRWVTVLLMVAIVALQFAPNWKGEKKDLSISNYLWFPEDVEDEVVATVTDTDVKVTVDDIVVVALCQLVGGVVAFFLYLTKKRGPFAAIAPIIAGGGGVIACLTKPVYQTGAMCTPILSVSAVALVIGAAMFIIGIVNLLIEEE